MEYHFDVYEENDFFWADCRELDGCHTQADNLEELKKNMKEVLNLYLEEPAESEKVFPLPVPSIRGRNVYEVEVEPQIAFAVLLRNLRARHHFTQKEVAEKLGMKNLYSYQRLEKKSNPTLVLLKKIKTVFPEISLDLILN